MNIVRVEKLRVSREEDKALDLTKQVCNVIIRDSHDPVLTEHAKETYRQLVALIEYIEEVSD